MKMMRRHQKKNLLQIFVCLTLLVRLSSSSFLLQTATDSSLADRESQIIGDSSFGLTRRDRKMLGNDSLQKENGSHESNKIYNSNLVGQPDSTSINAIKAVMCAVEETLLGELEKSTAPRSVEKIITKQLEITGKPLSATGDVKINQYFLPNSELADVYGTLFCSFSVASEFWTVTADLFDQGGESSNIRENYNLMISIQVADKSVADSASGTEPFYEDKHLLAVNLSRDGYISQLKGELQSILDTFVSEKGIIYKSLINSSIGYIYCELYKEILLIINKDPQDKSTLKTTEISSSKENCESLSDKTDTSSKTGHIPVDNVTFDKLDLSLSNTNGNSAIFKAEIGSLVFTMIVPRRGWNECVDREKDESNCAQILESFRKHFKTWWNDKVKNAYSVKTDNTNVESNKNPGESKFLSQIREYIMSGFKVEDRYDKANCFERISFNNVSNTKASTYTVLGAELPEENRFPQTFVIHLITSSKESNDDNDPCAHTKKAHRSPDYITIYFHRFTSGSLNYGHLAIDSETQYVESLVDLSKDIKSSIQNQIQDFLKSDEYLGVDQMPGHTFNQNDVFQYLQETDFNDKLKCITQQSVDGNNYQDFVKNINEFPLVQDRLKNSMFACANVDENSADFNLDNMVLIAQKTDDDKLVDIRLTWPKNFNHDNLNGSEEIKSGLDMQFDFPEYNAYDQIRDKIGDRIVKFLKLITCKQNRQRELQTVQGSKLQQLIEGTLINTNNQRNLQKTKPDSKVLQPGVEADINLSPDNKQPEESNTNSIKPNRKLVNYDTTLANSSTHKIGPKKTSIENELSLEKLSKIANEQSRVFDFEPIYNHPLTVRRYVKKTLILANQSWFDLQRFSTNNIHENSSSESLVTEKLAINKIAPRI